MQPFEWYAARPFKRPITREEYEDEVVAESARALEARGRTLRRCPRCDNDYVVGVSHFGSDECLVNEAAKAQRAVLRFRVDVRLKRYLEVCRIEIVDDFVLAYGSGATVKLAPFAPWWANSLLHVMGRKSQREKSCHQIVLLTACDERELLDDVAATLVQCAGDALDLGVFNAVMRLPAFAVYGCLAQMSAAGLHVMFYDRKHAMWATAHDVFRRELRDSVERMRLSFAEYAPRNLRPTLVCAHCNVRMEYERPPLLLPSQQQQQDKVVAWCPSCDLRVTGTWDAEQNGYLIG